VRSHLPSFPAYASSSPIRRSKIGHRLAKLTAIFAALFRVAARRRAAVYVQLSYPPSFTPIATMSSPTPLSAWQLPSLLIPIHQYKKSLIPNPKQRSHFLPIVAYVYRNRFAIASQIQRRFRHLLKSDRTTRRHLAELESLGYLAVIPTRGTSPLWPKTYFCTSAGARRLSRPLHARGKSGHVIRVDCARPEGYSAGHVLHELLTTELLVNVWEFTQVNSGFELLQTERRSIPSQPGFAIEARGRSGRLEPDAWFVYRQEGKGMMCCFCE
jgi:hypothetical protein